MRGCELWFVFKRLHQLQHTTQTRSVQICTLAENSERFPCTACVDGSENCGLADDKSVEM